MDTISSYMTGDHHRCDGLFAQAEAAASGQDWIVLAADLDAFLNAMQQHFRMEEEVLFPAFEQRTGMTMGPTQMMRMEHAQMRDLFEAMEVAVQQQDKDEFLGQAETLLIMMQQHNMKEEQILYQMADRVMSGEETEMLEKMRAVAP